MNYNYSGEAAEVSSGFTRGRKRIDDSDMDKHDEM